MLNNKQTKNAVNLGKNITVIKQDDREMLRNAFPEVSYSANNFNIQKYHYIKDFSVNSGEEDFTNQSLNSKNVEELLKV